MAEALPKRPSETGGKQTAAKNADRRQPTAGSMPRDEIRKKITPWWVSAEKCGVENDTGQMGKLERRWPLSAELEKYL